MIHQPLKASRPINLTQYSTRLIAPVICYLSNGKSETSSNIRLNNHRKNVKKPDAILACIYFQERNYVFNKHAKFIIIDKLTNTTKSKDILRQRLIERENF